MSEELTDELVDKETGEILERPEVRQPYNPPLSLEEMLEQRRVIEETKVRLMQEGIHFGLIPGCGKKPTLHKPGAEVLCQRFQLRPAFSWERDSVKTGHRGYEVKCTLIHIPTGQVKGQGMGYCSTMEAKYRYKSGFEDTGKPVPKKYWDSGKNGGERDASLIGGKGFLAKKNKDDQWTIHKRGEKVELENPSEYYNTALKMAGKRAYVAATLLATAASDYFTQDIEDMEFLHQAKPREDEQEKEPLSEKNPSFADAVAARTEERKKRDYSMKLYEEYSARITRCTSEEDLRGIRQELGSKEIASNMYDEWMTSLRREYKEAESKILRKAELSGEVDKMLEKKS